jgi:hypothetical protein
MRAAVIGRLTTLHDQHWARMGGYHPPVTALRGQRRGTDVRARQHRDRPQPADRPGLTATRGTAGWSRPGPQPVTAPGRPAGLVSADRRWRVDDVGYLP